MSFIFPPPPQTPELVLATFLGTCWWWIVNVPVCAGAARICLGCCCCVCECRQPVALPLALPSMMMMMMMIIIGWRWLWRWNGFGTLRAGKMCWPSTLRGPDKTVVIVIAIPVVAPPLPRRHPGRRCRHHLLCQLETTTKKMSVTSVDNDAAAVPVLRDGCCCLFVC
jgi:hypothetical protein